MTDTNIVGLLSLAGTCIGSLGGLRMTSYRIEQLEKKVDKHNNFAERIPVLEEKIESANDRIKNLEKHEEK
mgnify:FL=1